MTLRARVVRRPQSIHASSVELVCSLRVFWVLGCPLGITLGLDIFASQPATVQRASQATESGRVLCARRLKTVGFTDQRGLRSLNLLCAFGLLSAPLSIYDGE